MRIISVSATVSDENLDGISDLHRISFRIPLGPKEIVTGISLIAIFDYNLELYSRLKMESMIFADFQSSGPSAKLTIDGDLALNQRNPLHFRNDDLRFNVPIINASLISGTEFLLAKIGHDYFSRNFTTRLDPLQHYWLPGHTVGIQN